MSYNAPKPQGSHFWQKAKLAQITVCFGSNSFSIQHIVMKFAQLSHFITFSLLVKADCATLKDFLHTCTFIIFYIIKIHFHIIIIKPYKMIKSHKLNYLGTRRNIYRTILDNIYPNIFQTFSVIIWYVTSGAEKSVYSSKTPLVRIWAWNL